ncbi:unnamed protein product [Strongylus vulgaris]|uniref:Uncharacterized protein n=1 Tax=Strongylus vulgaris TaxID=40348 RepID=A0A3P7J7J3_STRVU|nr:unnamed protein product [Strongylus vulgaris]
MAPSKGCENLAINQTLPEAVHMFETREIKKEQLLKNRSGSLQKRPRTGRHSPKLESIENMEPFQKEEEKALSAKHGAYMMNNYYDKGAMVPYGYNTYAGELIVHKTTVKVNIILFRLR